jgi:glutaredoxin-related protein
MQIAFSWTNVLHFIHIDHAKYSFEDCRLRQLGIPLIQITRTQFLSPEDPLG